MTNRSQISAAVRQLYNTYPFPPEPLLDEPPPGYNWRWHWQAAYNFCTGRKPPRDDVQILDAGCGTGVGTEYLVHLNPQAQVTGIDLSDEAIAVARERCRRSGAQRVTLHNLSLYDVEQLDTHFDYINCVGVLHHLPDPIAGIQALASRLKPGGLMHVFVYAELGRREIYLAQQALALLQGGDRTNFKEGVRLGRQLFQALPDSNRLVVEDKRRWSLENHRDANFADMYLHPQEVDYNIETLFELIDASGLSFVGFSNPSYWDIDRLLGSDADLMGRSQQLAERDYYRLVELLDPELTHYEFFLSRPPLERCHWQEDATLRQATPEIHPCLQGWPSQSLFNYDYQIVTLSEAQFAFMQACEAGTSSVGDLCDRLEFDLEEVRSLLKQQLLMLSPSS
ncbi:class I SAM-dependent methyltransferase [Phormidium yuhuli AB48]|uniref:Class I SAM-dependent methyltransferase n=1 Tax=Phormidium yuhuli AB48 TaxID=2940671 RepID=A0ABY5AV51_9CYAN|nr:class I SAM-dependent methyltransferase [Phormidium yuhuli]USR92761.1 class I SAM-dependent methyltransferase [Phormidium yuhuli AB48]